jgi:hypothetical protein
MGVRCFDQALRTGLTPARNSLIPHLHIAIGSLYATMQDYSQQTAIQFQ